jgi:ABC-2 type transport system ATP-binding protein
MPEQYIVFDKITKQFGTKTVIDKLTLSIYKHEIFGIIGRSGAGKSTLLKMLIGFYPVTSGKILFQGKVLKGPEIKMHVGFCTQENSFYPELTVHENLSYYGKLYEIADFKKRETELLTLMNITSSKDVVASQLSGGMKRRLDFAISLIHKPQLLILDEPTTGLDPITEKAIWDLIKNLSSQGISIIIISHMLEYVGEYCHRVGFLANGTIVLDTTPAALKKKYHSKSFCDIFAEVLA